MSNEHECIHCGGWFMTAGHWEDCEKHPANATIIALRAEVERLTVDRNTWRDNYHKDILRANSDYDALRAEVDEAKAQEDEYMGYVATLGKALRDLSFAAQTTGGVAGRDEGLVAAIDAATYALSFVGVLKGMNLVADLRSQLSARDAEVESLAEKLRRSQVVNVALGHHEIDALRWRGAVWYTVAGESVDTRWWRAQLPKLSDDVGKDMDQWAQLGGGNG